MNRADCKALRSAALELKSWADSVRESHTRDGARDDWTGEEGAKATYDKHMRLVKRLRAIANAEQAKLPRKPRTVSLEMTEGTTEGGE